MADPFTVLVMNLNAMGFFGFLLPFIFAYAVVFALLYKSKWVDNQRINGVIALVFAFFVVGFGGPMLANFFVNLFGIATLIIAALLVIVLFIAMSGGDIGKVMGGKGTYAVLGGIGIIIFWIALGSFGVRISDGVIGIIFVIVLLAIGIVFITGAAK
jgi:hypothetical protein